MKFNLVNKVIIFVQKKRWRNDIGLKKKIISKYGVLELREDKDKFGIINSDPERNFVFCWSKWWECKNLKNKFVMVNPMFNGFIHQSYINDKFHHYALIEGEIFKKYLPKGLPFSVCRLVSIDHEQNNISKNIKKKYDWILISSLDPRKRHLDFLSELVKQNLENLKGCIIARDPNNKKKQFKDFFFNSPWRILDKIKKYQNQINFELFLNVHQSEKIKLTQLSKVFICSSKLDNGPRSQIEASQLCLPVISMTHIGSSDFINTKNKNGEIVDEISQIPDKLRYILENYSDYTCENNKLILSPDNFMPELINKIKKVYNK